MESPGHKGASQAIGGFARGNALGNQPNAADLQHDDQFTMVGPHKGKVRLYCVTQDPAGVQPEKLSDSFTVKMPIASQSIGQLIEETSNIFSPIKSMSLFYKIDSNF